MPHCNRADTSPSVVYGAVRPEREPTSERSLLTRELDKPIKEVMQMTAVPDSPGHPDSHGAAGAASDLSDAWNAIDWPTTPKRVLRLQVHIVKAQQAVLAPRPRLGVSKA